MKILILLFDGLTALDAIGPYDVLCRMPGSQIHFVGLEKRNYSDPYGLNICADISLNEANDADVLLIPGGTGIDNILDNAVIIEWIKKIHLKSKWTTAVCSGSILLAEAGVLKNKKCTTHWRRKDQLKKYNVDIINERYVRDGKIITSAGVSAGIDMALYLVSIIYNEKVARLIQLAIEYDPKPPFDSGSPEKVSQEMISLLNT